MKSGKIVQSNFEAILGVHEEKGSFGKKSKSQKIKY